MAVIRNDKKFFLMTDLGLSSSHSWHSASVVWWIL